MKASFFKRCLIVGCFSGGSAFAKKMEKTVSKSDNKIDLSVEFNQISYALGRLTGDNMVNQNLEVEVEVFKVALNEALEGKPSQMTDAAIKEAMEKVREHQQVKMAAKAEESKKEGDAFLADHAKKPDVIVTKSGLQYKKVTNGKGSVSPKIGDQVKVHYQGTFINGKVFDSSYDRGEPAVFGLDSVIPGWTEALKLMQVGDKWELVIPANLAYGSRPKPGIPANSVLKFTVELLEIMKADTKKK